MHRANLVERKLRRPGSPQAKPAKRVVPASRLPNRDPPATSAKRPRRNARRPTAFVANERRQRNAKTARTAAVAATVARRRPDDSLVANPTRTRINQLERRLDDAPKRPPFSVRFRTQLPFLRSFSTARSTTVRRFFVHCTQKTPRRKRPNKANRRLNEKNCEKKNRVRAFRPFPTPSISVIMRNGGNLRRRTVVKTGKFDKTARFWPLVGRKFLRRRRVATFFRRNFLFRASFFTEIIKNTTRSRKRFPRTIPRNPTERTLKWPILRT